MAMRGGVYIDLSRSYRKRLHNIEAHNLCSSPNIITFSESRRLDGEGNSMGEAVNTLKVAVKTWRKSSSDTETHGRIKINLNKM